MSPAYDSDAPDLEDPCEADVDEEAFPHLQCWWCGTRDGELRKYDDEKSLCVDCHPWWNDADDAEVQK